MNVVASLLAKVLSIVAGGQPRPAADIGSMTRAETPAPPAAVAEPLPAWRGRGFGYKTAWIAVRSASREPVVAALGLERTAPATWRDGIDAAYRQGRGTVAVTPGIDGWVLAVGNELSYGGLDDTRLDVETLPLAALLRRLSLDFGEAQFFATHRVGDGHLWYRYVEGRPVRQFLYRDGGFQARGEPTEVEAAILTPDADDYVAIDEEQVMAVARGWSVDPTGLEDPRYDRLDAAGLVVGSLPPGLVALPGRTPDPDRAR